jgi:predicted chitinase
MSAWKDFLAKNDDLAALLNNDGPGPILVNFVNRYLQPLDSLLYRIEYEGNMARGVTTATSHTVEVKPKTLRPVRVFVWSKLRGEFKLIAEIKPRAQQRLLVSLRMKTFRHSSKTEVHPMKREDKADGKPHAASTPNDSAEGSWEAAEQGVQFAKGKNKKHEPEHKTRRSETAQIAKEQLKKIFPAGSEAHLGRIADELNTDLEKYKLDTPLRRAHFFAQVRQEAGAALSAKQECLNYRPEVLIDKFGYFKKRPEEAQLDGRLEELRPIEGAITGKNSSGGVKKRVIRPADQVTIANKVYAKRNGNGDIDTGDGWKFRGRGIFQLTGRGNYTRFNGQYASLWSDGDPDFINNPDKLCEFPYYIRSAVWFWVSHSIYLNADNGARDSDIDSITEKVNGDAKDAAAERRHNFHELCYPAFK